MAKMNFAALPEAPQDSLELAAYKSKVLTVAMRYKNTYRWCNEIEPLLAEIGLKPAKEKKVKVIVTTTHPFIFNIQVEPAEYRHLTEVEQKTKVIGVINKTIGALTLPAESIATMEVQARAAAAAGQTAELDQDHPNYAWRYTGNEGRVLHAFTRAPTRTSGLHRHALCSAEGYYDPTETSERGENRPCATCLSRIAQRYPLTAHV